MSSARFEGGHRPSSRYPGIADIEQASPSNKSVWYSKQATKSPRGSGFYLPIDWQLDNAFAGVGVERRVVRNDLFAWENVARRDCDPFAVQDASFKSDIYAELLTLDEYDAGYRLVVAD